jgi:hypothetical protein
VPPKLIVPEGGKKKLAAIAAKYGLKKAASLPFVDRGLEKQALEPRHVAKYGLPALFAAVSGVGSYLGTRKAPGSQKSKAEEAAQELVDAADRKPLKEQSFVRRLGGDTARFTRDVAKTYQDNPKASTALSALLGGMAGHGLARALGAK